MPDATVWRVAVALPVGALDFAPPVGWQQHGAALGCRVLVPWQSGTRVGVVLAIGEASTDPARRRDLALREVIAVLDDQPVLGPDGCALLLAQSEVLFAPVGVLLQDFLPWGLDPDLDHTLRVLPNVDVSALPKGTSALRTWSPATTHDPSLVELLRSQGLLEERVALLALQQEHVRPVDAPDAATLAKLTDKQRAAWDALVAAKEYPSIAALARAANVSAAVAGKLFSLGLAHFVASDAPLPQALTTRAITPPVLKHVALPDAALVRLHGGRSTQRFAALANHIKRCNGGVLFLAPDRASLEAAFVALGGLRPSAVLDFGASPRLRESVWRGAASGEIEVVFGTPMSLLCPVKNLELLIVQSEHSDAYKLLGGSRAFVPDVAEARLAALQKAGHTARLVLTGAVMAVESLQHPGVVLPPPTARLHVVDYALEKHAPEMGPLSNFALGRESWPLSNALKNLLRQVAERGRQAVLIAPRRGYSAVVRCNDCGWSPSCPNCDVGLRFHSERRALECHQCGHKQRPPTRCPGCEGVVLHPKGPGSEWIAAELRRFLPGVAVYRCDKDQRDDLAPLQRGEPGVIVGTTAVLSQAAPSNLALVALTFADTMLANSDFRVGERYHALLRELIEWHPKRAPLLVVQTFQAAHPALQSVLAGEDASVYPALEFAQRQELHYPPFGRLALVQLAARKNDAAQRAAHNLAKLIQDRGATPQELLGPAPAPIARIKGLFAHHLLLRAGSETRLRELLAPAQRFRDGAQVRIEINPRGFTALLE